MFCSEAIGWRLITADRVGVGGGKTGVVTLKIVEAFELPEERVAVVPTEPGKIGDFLG
jgi:hypothetical protein